MLPRTWVIPIKSKDLRVLNETKTLHYELAELTVNLRLGGGWPVDPEAVIAELSVTFIPNDEGHRFTGPT